MSEMYYSIIWGFKELFFRFCYILPNTYINIDIFPCAAIVVGVAYTASIPYTAICSDQARSAYRCFGS